MTRTLAVAVPALALLSACGGSGGGARPAEGPEARQASAICAAAADTVAAADAVIAIDATVRAEALEHRVEPRASVRFSGDTPADTLSCSERRNLDRPVRAGRTYRDVQIDYHLRVRLDTAAVFRAVADSVAAVRDTARRP